MTCKDGAHDFGPDWPDDTDVITCACGQQQALLSDDGDIIGLRSSR